MTTDLPPTFDRLLSDVQAQAKGLIETLHRMESHVDKQTGQAGEADRDEFRRVSVRLWQAIGMAEGVLHMVELAERQRPRRLC